MTVSALDNLARAGQLKREAADAFEVRRMLALAEKRLGDARLKGLSPEGRFLSAYNAAHAASLAALRWHGFRSENRYLVFQCLEHTVGWPAARWRVLDAAHRKRNLAEYEGHAEVEESGIAELARLAAELLADVKRLVGQD